MKKEETLQLIENLNGFLDNIQSINNHPYSTGVDVNRLLHDLQDYLKDMKAVVEQINEVEESEQEENSE